MNAKSLWAAVFFVALTVHADENSELEASRVKIACRDRYRKVDDKLYDLSPRFFWANEAITLGHSQVFSEKPLPDWQFIWGKVFQVSDDGILLRKYGEFDYSMSDDYELVFIHHYKRGVVDDSVVALYAVPSGRYSYVSTLGARKTFILMITAKYQPATTSKS